MKGSVGLCTASSVAQGWSLPVFVILTSWNCPHSHCLSIWNDGKRMSTIPKPVKHRSGLHKPAVRPCDGLLTFACFALCVSTRSILNLHHSQALKSPRRGGLQIHENFLSVKNFLCVHVTRLSVGHQPVTRNLDGQRDVVSWTPL